MEANDTLQQLREAKDPVARWKILQSAPPGLREQPELRDEEQWWLARYKFMDRKQTRVQDKFIWMLMFFSTWAQQSKSLKNTKEPAKVYAQTLGQPEMDAVLDKPDLYERLYDAADTYVKTISAERLLLGIMPMKDKSPEQTNKRVAQNLVCYSLLPIAVCCKDKPVAAVLVRALYASAVTRFDGIRPFILEFVDQVESAGDRAFISSCIDDVQDLYDGSKI